MIFDNPYLLIFTWNQYWIINTWYLIAPSRSCCTSCNFLYMIYRIKLLVSSFQLKYIRIPFHPNTQPLFLDPKSWLHHCAPTAHQWHVPEDRREASCPWWWHPWACSQQSPAPPPTCPGLGRMWSWDIPTPSECRGWSDLYGTLQGPAEPAVKFTVYVDEALNIHRANIYINKTWSSLSNSSLSFDHS